MKRKFAYIALGTTTILMCFLLVANLYVYASDVAYISFSSNRTGNWDIYVIDTNGENLHNLTNHPAYDAFATWSPDGRAFAFVSDRDGNHEIYIMEVNETEPRRLTNHPAPDRDPDWSPDGNWIVFTSNRTGEPNYDIYKIDINGENLRRLADDEKYDLNPAWSPDGEQIAFFSNRDEGTGIYVMNADGKRPRRIAKGHAGTDPSWAPDGKQIAYSANLAGSGIYTVSVHGQNPRRVTPMNIWSRHPAWSPDGKLITYDADIKKPWGNPNKDSNVYVVSVTGGTPRQITKHAAQDGYPAWVPLGFLDVSASPEKLITQWSRLKKSEIAPK